MRDKDLKTVHFFSVNEVTLTHFSPMFHFCSHSVSQGTDPPSKPQPTIFFASQALKSFTELGIQEARNLYNNF